MTRAAIYTRLSHDADGLSSSTADQERECRAECERRGWIVVEVYSDNDVPASEAQAYRARPRKAYARLLNAVKAGQVDVIVAWATDRLYRHPVDLEGLLHLAEQHGVRFATLSGEVRLMKALGTMPVYFDEAATSGLDNEAFTLTLFNLAQGRGRLVAKTDKTNFTDDRAGMGHPARAPPLVTYTLAWTGAPSVPDDRFASVWNRASGRG